MKLNITIILLIIAASSASLQSSTLKLSKFKCLNGTNSDKQEFLGIVKSCSAKSRTFKTELRRFILSETCLDLVNNTNKELNGGTIGAFSNDSSVNHKIALKLLNPFPELILDSISGKYKFIGKVPDWATSKCMVLLHELVEAKYHKNTGKSFPYCHKKAIAAENRMRREMISNQCRNVEYINNEMDKVPHTDHSDLVIRIGNHSERFHRHVVNGRISLKIEYEIGNDKKCDKRNYN